MLPFVSGAQHNAANTTSVGVSGNPTLQFSQTMLMRVPRVGPCLPGVTPKRKENYKFFKVSMLVFLWPVEPIKIIIMN